MSIDLLNGWTGRDSEGGGGAVRLALARGWRSSLLKGRLKAL